MLLKQRGFRLRAVAVWCVVALLAGCGGGGGGSGGGAFLALPPAAQPQPQPVSTYVVGGAVLGLEGTVVLQNNAGDDLTISADGTFTFKGTLNKDAAYDVTVRSQPLWQNCTVSNGKATATADVADVSVSCSVALASVSTFAGSGVNDEIDGGAAVAAFSEPLGVAFEQGGGLVVSQGSGRVRRVSPAGDVSALATIGNAFVGLGGIAAAPSGNFYAGQCHQVNNQATVQQVTPAGVVSIFAGAQFGTSDGTGAAASFVCPFGIAVDAGNFIYVADQQAHTIRKISPGGDVITLAGQALVGSYVDATGTAAAFNNPKGIAVDSAGTLFVADLSNRRIRKITPDGVVSTLAGSGANGSDDGAADVASFTAPSGIALDRTGAVYVTDGNLLRRVSATGKVTTLAGQPGVASAVNGVGTVATFNGPVGLAIRDDGTIYIADRLNNVIRQVTPVPAP